MQKNLNLAVKDRQVKLAELFKVAKLQSEIVYDLDDKFILDIEPTANLKPSSYTITINLSQK